MCVCVCVYLVKSTVCDFVNASLLIHTLCFMCVMNILTCLEQKTWEVCSFIYFAGLREANDLKKNKCGREISLLSP